MFRHMEYIYCVYQEKSFSRAAERLYISQSSLSLTIKKAEERIGTPIFDRKTTPLSLTEFGEEYISAVEKVMRLRDGLDNFLYETEHLSRGHISLGAANFCISYLLPPLLTAFRQAYPKIQVELHERSTPSLIRMLSEGRIDMMISNMAAGEVAMRTGFRGDNFCTVTACASSTHAIGEAFRKIKDGYLDACLCGGTESTITEFTLGGFKTMKALTKASDPAKASTPFDLNRSGFVLGEGCGVLLLEEYEHAKARGAKIYAELVGYGATGDAYHITSPAEDGEGAGMAMKLAMQEAGVAPEQIDYINAHGTSTHHNDLFETKAIKFALGDAAKNVSINSTKSMIGHLLGAAGGVEFVVCVKSIQDGFIHQTVGTENVDPECDLDYTVGAPVEKDVNYVLTNSLGFGGHNATLLLKKYED